MKNLSYYDKYEEPIVLRQDMIRNSRGVGYYGSKMRDKESLFQN